MTEHATRLVGGKRFSVRYLAALARRFGAEVFGESDTRTAGGDWLAALGGDEFQRRYLECIDRGELIASEGVLDELIDIELPVTAKLVAAQVTATAQKVPAGIDPLVDLMLAARAIDPALSALPNSLRARGWTAYRCVETLMVDLARLAVSEEREAEGWERGVAELAGGAA